MLFLKRSASIGLQPKHYGCGISVCWEEMLLEVEMYVTKQLRESSDLYTRLESECRGQIVKMARAAVDTLQAGGKILLCGNGGSASDAEHIAAEFVGRFRRDRTPLPAIALTANGADLTAIGNDFGFEHVFSRQVYALGEPGDLLICFSTSGQSRNVLEAAKAACNIGLKTVGLTGCNGQSLTSLCHVSVSVPSAVTAHIQECHISICHLMCEIVDEALANQDASEPPDPLTKIVSMTDLLSLRARWRATRRTLVWTNGCFDLLHIGHIRSLRQARALGDVLVVGINSDDSVRRMKGENRPVVPEQERAEIIAALDCVDRVIIFGDTTPEQVLAELKPEFHCKGEEYKTADGKPLPEEAVVTGYGGQVRFIPMVPEHSTTGAIEKIISSNWSGKAVRH
jgi:phosphoheptose isomerase